MATMTTAQYKTETANETYHLYGVLPRSSLARKHRSIKHELVVNNEINNNATTLRCQCIQVSITAQL